MSIEFSQITAKLNYPSQIKGKLSSLHADVITYVCKIYDGSHKLRTRTISLMNTLSRYIQDGDTIPDNWNPEINPFDNIEIEDDDDLKLALGSLYIVPKNIEWDIPVVKEVEVASIASIRGGDEAEVSKSASASEATRVNKQAAKSTNSGKIHSVTSNVPMGSTLKKKTRFASRVKLVDETDKRDLYIASPVVPQFDVNRPWMSTVIDGTMYCVYTSIPLIPTKQNEISVTTNVDLMGDSDLMNLYPHNFIKTRPPIMYKPVDTLKYHPQLGTILTVDGFTEEQVIDNIIRYPHLFKLFKIHDGEIVSFYNTIEIKGELRRVVEVWKSLPDAATVPYNIDFVKEYVVRRYLLERDIKGIEHKNPMFGTLDPFLTLFTTPADYIKWGYTDVLNLAKKCVESRVSYKRSRNPVVRRIQDNV